MAKFELSVYHTYSKWSTHQVEAEDEYEAMQKLEESGYKDYMISESDIDYLDSEIQTCENLDNPDE